MRLIFMGTPDFAVPALQALHAAGHEIVAVYTQPARPAGRGKKVRPSAIAHCAKQLKLNCYTPTTLVEDEVQAQFLDHQADMAVVAAYGLLLPRPILDACHYGCLNIHASLLPRWRGAAPIQRAILAGDDETGITIMQMEEGLDSGAMLMQEAVAILPSTDAAILHDALAQLGSELIVKAVANRNQWQAKKQDEQQVSYAKKISKQEARIDWQQPAEAVLRHVRAFHPWPGAYFQHQGNIIKLLDASIGVTKPHDYSPGTIIEAGTSIVTQEGILQLRMVQRQGKKPMNINEFLRGYALEDGGKVD